MAHGSNATLATVMVLGVLVLLYLFADLARPVDLSEGASNTLQAETVQKLCCWTRTCKRSITAYTNQRKDDSYFGPRSRTAQGSSRACRGAPGGLRPGAPHRGEAGRRRLGRRHPARGRPVDIRPSLPAAGKGRDRRLEFVGESAVSRALAAQPHGGTVYVLSGHGELDPDDRTLRVLRLVAALDLSGTTWRSSTPPDRPGRRAAAGPGRRRGGDGGAPHRGAHRPGAGLALAGSAGVGPCSSPWTSASPRRTCSAASVRDPDGVALQPEMQVPFRDGRSRSTGRTPSTPAHRVGRRPWPCRRRWRPPTRSRGRPAEHPADDHPRGLDRPGRRAVGGRRRL